MIDRMAVLWLPCDDKNKCDHMAAGVLDCTTVFCFIDVCLFFFSNGYFNCINHTSCVLLTLEIIRHQRVEQNVATVLRNGRTLITLGFY